MKEEKKRSKSVQTAPIPSPANAPARSSSHKPPLAARRARRRPETFTISFRVDASRLRALEQGAEELGLSVHEFARMVTYQSLERPDPDRLFDEMAQTRQMVSLLRDDLSKSIEVILSNTTRAEPSQIRAWINENLRQTL